jgi:gas vesicle protein GvpA/GvpJ/GvpM family
MSLQRASADASLIDVLDHVLDKGIVVDAWMQVALVRISCPLTAGVKPFQCRSASVGNRACRILRSLDGRQDP